MPSEVHALVAFIIAAALSALATPVMARVARETGILDRPTGYKKHERPTPYLGGIAILFGVLAAMLATTGLSSPVPAVAAAAVAVCALGTMDDRRPISPTPRLALQAIIAVVIWKAGAGWSLAIHEWANLALTIAWIVLATNAFNLIDNLDGTAAASAAASALGIGVLALGNAADDWPALLAAAVLGACLGFLPYNLSKPARIFLGDGGSTLLGFLLAVAVMGALPSTPEPISLVAAVLLIGTVIFDTALTIASRLWRGVPVLTGGRDHVTHRVLAWVGSARKTAVVVAATQAVLSALAVAAVELRLPAIPVALVILLTLALPAAVVVWRAGLGPTGPTSGPLPRVGKPG